MKRFRDFAAASLVGWFRHARRHGSGSLRGAAPLRGTPTEKYSSVKLSIEDVLNHEFSDVADLCREAAGEILALLPNGDYTNLAFNSPGLEDYDWSDYLRLSMLRLARVARVLKAQGKPGQHLLDFGSYFGNFSLLARKMGFDVDALDTYSRYAPALSGERALLERYGVRILDTTEHADLFDRRGKSYDFVLLMGVIEHIPHSPRALLENLNRHIRMGGQLIVDTPNLGYIYRREALGRGESVFPPIDIQFNSPVPFEGHHREYLPSEVNWMLEQTGFEAGMSETFNYSLFGMEEACGEDARRYREMEADPTKRELIFVSGKKVRDAAQAAPSMNAGNQQGTIPERSAGQWLVRTGASGSKCSSVEPTKSTPLNGNEITDEMNMQIGIAAPALREILKIAVKRIIDETKADDQVRIERPLPFSRARGKDYLALLAMWRRHMGGRIENLPPRACPACAGEDRVFLFHSCDNYPYATCRDCGTWYVPHRVTDEIIEAFHAEVPEARVIADRMMSGRDEGTRAVDRARFGRYFEMLQPLFEDRKTKMRYLDIGSGVGHSVELAAERGMEATGVEISHIAVKIARAKGRNVVLPSETDTGVTYDLVSLFETLEHVPEPDKIIGTAEASLAPGGAVVVTVPNRACWEISVLRERCFHIYGGTDGIGHINLFDIDGLRRLFARHGLSLVYADAEHGSDVLQLFGQMMNGDKPALDMILEWRADLQIPESAFALLNATGPVLSLLERALIRSPILVTVACRREDVERLQPMIDEMEANRRANLLSLLETV